MTDDASAGGTSDRTITAPADGLSLAPPALQPIFAPPVAPPDARPRLSPPPVSLPPVSPAPVSLPPVWGQPRHGAAGTTDLSGSADVADVAGVAVVRGPGRRSRPLVLGLAGVGVLVVVLAGAAAARAGHTVPRGTTIGGVAVGGLSRDAAVDQLTTALAGSSQPLPVRAGERSAAVQPSAAGLTVDAARSVDAVLGAGLSPSLLWRHVTGGPQAPTLPAPDHAAIVAALAQVQRSVDVPATDGAITFSAGGPAAVRAVTGSTLDVEAAADVIARGWLDRSAPLELPVRTTPPAIPQTEVDRAMAAVAVPASSGPLRLDAGAASVTIPRETLLPLLSMRARKAATPPALELVVDGERLRTAALALNAELERKPVDATIVLRDGAPVVVPSVDGTKIDPVALAAAATTAVLGAERTAVVTPKPTPATLTTQKATALGVTEKVSTFSTNLTSNVPRTNNLRLAARTVDGTLVLPGATFSLNDVLGKRTPEKGYSQAPVINGGRLTIDYGGGVSQMATTIYNNVFFAGLQDVHHMPHSFYISRYPEGREATVSFPTVDLLWRNDSPYAVLVEASVTKTVNVSFWSTKVYDQVVAEKDPRTNPRTPKTIYDPRPGCVTQEANPGFDVVVRRKLYTGGALVRTQSWRTSYIAEDKVVCGPKPADQPPTPD